MTTATQPKRAVRSTQKRAAPKPKAKSAAKPAPEAVPDPEPQDLAATEPSERRTDEMGEDLGPENIRRVPMGTHVSRLGGEQRPGYYRRWINNVYGRIERAKRAAYEHVKDRQGNPVSAPVGTEEQGGGLRAYFMEIPQKFRDEDLAAKRAVNDEIDRALHRGTLKEQADDKRYVPEGGIKITGGASPRS